MTITQEIINVGTVANDRTGDKWRASLIKCNTNFTNLTNFANAQVFVSIAQESDFATQTATVITLETDTIYVVTASFSTAKRFDCQDGSVLTMFSASSSLLTYSGTGTMFSGADASFSIFDARITCPLAKTFDFSDSVGNTKIFLARNVFILESLKAGDFDDLVNTQFFSCGFLDTDGGITVTGSTSLAFTIDRLALISTSATFKGVDLGSAVIANIEFNNLIVVAPAGAIGVTGLANSGNIPAGVGAAAMLTNSSFSGGMTTLLQNISKDDIRWILKNNPPIEDTFPDGLLSFVGNSTETVIASSGVAVLVNATWTVISVSQFSGSTGGRLTYNGERGLPGPVDVSCGLISAGGGSIDVQVSLALNGTVIATSSTPISISGSNPAHISIPWQLNLEENDFLEVFVQNDSNTTNIIVEFCRLRIR